ncbi:unnamed protein product [Spodoptera exigua]|nr:unnamed protein product [Spodoptera exigua]
MAAPGVGMVTASAIAQCLVCQFARSARLLVMDIYITFSTYCCEIHLEFYLPTRLCSGFHSFNTLSKLLLSKIHS